uniref:Uncharacterized protein n=1 Tax=Ditylenchus dipsaci TaxID=166011 RepID=A0A915DRC2_9BILA
MSTASDQRKKGEAGQTANPSWDFQPVLANQPTLSTVYSPVARRLITFLNRSINRKSINRWMVDADG